MNAKETANDILQFAATVQKQTGRPVSLLSAWEALRAAQGETLQDVAPEYAIPGAEHRPVTAAIGGRPKNRLYGELAREMGKSHGGDRKSAAAKSSGRIGHLKGNKSRTIVAAKAGIGPKEFYLDAWVTKTLSRSRIAK